MNLFKKLALWFRTHELMYLENADLRKENDEIFHDLTRTASEHFELKKKYKELEDRLHSSHKEMVHWKEKALLFMSYHKEKNGRSS